MRIAIGIFGIVAGIWLIIVMLFANKKQLIKENLKLFYAAMLLLGLRTLVAPRALRAMMTPLEPIAHFAALPFL